MFERRRTLRQAKTPGKARDFVIRPSAPPSPKNWPAGPMSACATHVAGRRRPDRYANDAAVASRAGPRSLPGPSPGLALLRDPAADVFRAPDGHPLRKLDRLGKGARLDAPPERRFGDGNEGQHLGLAQGSRSRATSGIETGAAGVVGRALEAATFAAVLVRMLGMIGPRHGGCR